MADSSDYSTFDSDSDYQSDSPGRFPNIIDCKHMELDEYPDCGLIFVGTEDAPSLVSMAITKQPYSTIGFFYKTRVSGRLAINVIMVDIYRFTLPSWTGKGSTLQDLIENPLVNRVAIKGLRPIMDEDDYVDRDATNILHSKFRQAMGLILQNGTETSLTEVISQLFGYEVDHPTKGVTAIEMINRVIALIGEESKVPQDGSLSAAAIRSLDAPDILGNDIESKGKMMQILAANFNQQEVDNPSVANKLMQSYIVENDLFDDLIEIPLPPRDCCVKLERQQVSIMLQSDYMAAIVSQFVKMLVNDQGFYRTVLAGFNQTRMVTIKREDEYRKSLLDLADDGENLARLLIKWIYRGEIDYIKLLSLVSKFDDTRDSIAQKHNCVMGDRMKLPIINKSKLLLLRKNRKPTRIPDRMNCQATDGEGRKHDGPEDEGHKDEEHKDEGYEDEGYEGDAKRAEDREWAEDRDGSRDDKRYLVGAHLALRDQFQKILDIMNCEERDPIVDLNDMLKNMNDIGSALGIEAPPLELLPGEYSCRAILNITNVSPCCVPLVLKCGKHITLPLANADLSGFDRDVLEEILETLDLTASTDYRFSKLRGQITFRLAHM